MLRDFNRPNSIRSVRQELPLRKVNSTLRPPAIWLRRRDV